VQLLGSVGATPKPIPFLYRVRGFGIAATIADRFAAGQSAAK
jgi:hypothetical protein